MYDALWALINQYPNVGDIVKKQVSFNANEQRDPIPQRVVPGELPELTLVQDIVNANHHLNQSIARVTVDYSFLISTGDFRQQQGINPVLWMLFVTTANWPRYLNTFTWPDEDWKPVKNYDIIDATQGMSDKDRNRNLTGWSAVWRCRVELHFRRSDLYALIP